MTIAYSLRIQVISRSSKGQVFFRRLLKRQHSILNAFAVTRKCPRCM